MSVKCPKCQHENPEDTQFCGKCATRLPTQEKAVVTETLETPKEELTRGTIFAERYEIIEELGKGGMGRVYKAHDTKIKEKIALKLIKPEIAKDKKTIERFSNELRLARKIRHKNICGMFDLGEDKGIHYITMEFVPGEDLRSLIRRIGQMPIGKSISIASQVCEGLAEAHRLGVVHRDLKSNNIMIDDEGNVRIMDFGIARSLEAKGITGAGVMIGTPEYMSPEQVEGKEIDQRSDIYSLGVILYEMLTGRVPFEGDTPFTIGMKHKGEMPQNPKELNTQISDDLNRLILRCLEKDKDKRYQSAGEARSELENMEKGISTTERIESRRKPITSKEITVTFGLKKLFIPGLVIVALVILVVVIWQPWSQKETIPIPSDKPSLAVMYFKNNTGDENFEIWRTALSDSIITDLSQSKYIRVLSGDRLYSILKKLNLLEERTYAAEDLEGVAVEGRVNHILQGSLSKAGENFRVEYTLQEINTGKIIGSERVEGTGEESIFSMVDELTKKIKKNFQLTPAEIAGDTDKDITEVTTSSPEAFKYYSEATKNLNQGRYAQVIPLLEKAVAIDPDFAMAYSHMATLYSSRGYRSQANMFWQKAFRLRERLPDRERHIIEGGFYAQTEKTYDKAIEACNKLLEFYPEDFHGNLYLGFIYLELEKWDQAIELLEVPIQNMVETPFFHAVLGVAYCAKGLYAEAEEALQKYLDNFGDNMIILGDLAHINIYQGKYDRALQVAEEVLFVPWFYHLAKGYAYLLMGDFPEAERQYRSLLDSKDQQNQFRAIDRLVRLYVLQGRFDEAKAQLRRGQKKAEEVSNFMRMNNFHAYQSYMLEQSGNFEEALQELEKALEISVQVENLRWQRLLSARKAGIYIEMKDMDRAQREIDTLKKMIEEGMNRKEIRWYHLATGMMELEKENFSRAIEALEKSKDLLPFESYHGVFYLIDNAIFLRPLALAYYRSGDLEKAGAVYEKIISLTSCKIFYGDIYAKSLYMLGKIREEQGNIARAIEHYEKFLDLWKDADPGIAEVEDARKRLAGLKISK